MQVSESLARRRGAADLSPGLRNAPVDPGPCRACGLKLIGLLWWKPIGFPLAGDLAALYAQLAK